MRIYLVGFKNSGKTTTGERLARKLGFDFVDLDGLIEKNDGRTVPEIFTQDGEDEFRRKEQEALHQTGQMENIVVATGGGVPRFFDNMSFMKREGVTIYLQLDKDTLIGRLKEAAKDRPIVKGKTTAQIREYVNDLYSKYEHLYLQSSYVVNSRDILPNDLVNKIIRNYPLNEKPLE